MQVHVMFIIYADLLINSLVVRSYLIDFLTASSILAKEIQQRIDFQGNDAWPYNELGSRGNVINPCDSVKLISEAQPPK